MKRNFDSHHTLHCRCPGASVFSCLFNIKLNRNRILSCGKNNKAMDLKTRGSLQKLIPNRIDTLIKF